MPLTASLRKFEHQSVVIHSEESDRKTERSRSSTRSMLRAAIELIAEGGYENATLAGIGRRAGFSHGLVTRRFGSKEGLLTALLDRLVVRWHIDYMAPRLRQATGVDAAEELVEGIAASARRDPTAMRALYVLIFEAVKPEPSILRQRISEIQRHQRELLGRAFARGIELGTVPPYISPEEAAALVSSAIRGATYQWMLDPDFDLQSTFSALKKHLRRTMATESLPPAP